MEFEVQLVNGKITVIDFDTILNEITEATKKYANLVVQEDDLQSAKSKRAELNKIKAAIDDKRKSIKKEYMTPYTNYENQSKQLIAKVDEAVINIDSQIKNYEENEKAIKHEAISKMFEDLKQELNFNCPVEFSRLDDERYLNSTFTMKKVEEDLRVKMNQILKDVSLLEKQNYSIDVFDTYYSTLDYQNTINDYLDKQARIKALEEQRTQQKKVEEVKKEDVEPKIISTKPTQYFKLTFEVTATLEEITNLKEYMEEHNIQFERVGK